MENFLEHFEPLEYRLNLVINRTEETFCGVSSIYGCIPKYQPKPPSQPEVVKFHAVGMEIDGVMYHPMSEVGYEDEHGVEMYKYDAMPCEFEYDGEVLTIPITQKMHARIHDPAAKAAYYGEPDNYRPEVSFDIQFRAKLKHNMQGCYLSTYQHDGQTQKIVTTQFESHYAREAFPCIDIPAAKARFSLNIEVPDLTSSDTILSNMPLSSHTGTRFFFQTSPKMSTYLLAWVIGPLQSVSTVNKHGVKVTSYAALNQSLTSLLFANDTAAKALDFYDEKFGVKYPLPKLDQVALPDFEAGAMENWGLVTYRESCLLADESATLEAKQSVAITVTHELSHQWFGDLVTMAWWDDLWLNESFATMMEFVATDALYPEFNIWQDFFTSDCIAALRRDSLPGVQSVQQEVHDPAEIATLFDSAIVYAKGARLMLMLYRLMGDKAFMKGIRDYFKKYQYQNTVGDDLWNSLQPYADFGVREFMHAWISQPGYPAIIIPEASSIPEAQHRFLINGQTDDTVWPLPEVKDDMSGHYLLYLSDHQFADKLNRFAELSLEQKLRLLIDRMLLSKTPEVPSASLLDLIPLFVDEASAPIRNILTSIIADLKLLCPPDTESAELYKRYLSRLYKPYFGAIDLGPLPDENAIRVRDSLLNLAYYVEDENILTRLANMYQSDSSTDQSNSDTEQPGSSSKKSNLAKLDPELRCHILAAKLYKDESTIFPAFLEQYQTETDPELKSDLLSTIASLSRQPEHLDRLMELLDQPEIVRPQDHILLYIDLLRNHRTRARVLDWLTTHWDYIKQLTGDKSIEDYPLYASVLIRTPEEAAVFYNFFDPLQDDPILKRTLKMARTDIDCRLQTIKTDAPTVHQKLHALVERNK